MQLLVATNNPGKLKEYRDLLLRLAVEIITLDEAGIDFVPEETGATFEENAIIKAGAFFELSRLPTLADDSGLEIDFLSGAPGVLSARYGGTGRNEEVERYQIVLDQLAGVPWKDRTARFRCVLAIAFPGQPLLTTEGVVEGFIADAPSGQGGFGYDPIFYLTDFGCTMAELPAETKNRISHRGRAIEAALPLLQQLIKKDD